MENKNVAYYAWVSNEQGATADVVGRFGSQRKIEESARRQFGSGWTVHVMKVDVPEGGEFAEPEEIKTFKIR